MLVTINGKVVKPKKETQKKPMMSPWFKKWLLLIGGLFLLLLAPASFLKFDEGLVMAWLLFFLLCLMIFGVVVAIQTIITVIRKFLKFRMVIYY